MTPEGSLRALISWDLWWVDRNLYQTPVANIRNPKKSSKFTGMIIAFFECFLFFPVLLEINDDRWEHRKPVLVFTIFASLKP